MDYSVSAWKFLIGIGLILEGCHLTNGAAEISCGFPGTPAYGFLKPFKDTFKAGEIVTYSCRVGYILLGPPISRCLPDGSWTEDIPICDDSMTTLGVAFSTPALPGHPAEMAIDRNKNTCTYLKPKHPRWWRIDLGGLHKILSVAVTLVSTDKFVEFTVYVIQIHGQSASYNRCIKFSGKFGSNTVVFSCAEGKGIEGQRVHIEDHRQMEGLFEICEVEVQVKKDTGYDCGRPDRRPYSITYEPENGKVHYGCVKGYRLRGQSTRQCRSTGQWSGHAPVCYPIICDILDPLKNGNFSYQEMVGDVPLEGTVVSYECQDGYKLQGAFTRHCLEDGSWSDAPPSCEAIRCPILEGRNSAEIYRLLNKTTRMGSMVELKCRRGSKREGDGYYLYCTEEGVWTEPKASCILPPGASIMKDRPRIAKEGGVIFGMVVAVLMMLTVAVSFFIIKRRRDANKPDLPSRQYEPPAPPPRPPPRAKGIRSTIIDFMNRDSPMPKYGALDTEAANERAWKTRSLPLEPEIESETKRALSYDGASKSLLDKSTAGKQPDSSADATAPDETEDQTELKKENKDESSAGRGTPSQRTGGDYAEVDYEKKRQSRLIRDQSSEGPTPSTSPVMENVQLRELPPIPAEERENEKSVTPNENYGEKRDQDEEESEESEDVSLPIVQSDSPTSGNATPSPDVVIENQVDGITESSTSTPDDRSGRRTRGRQADQTSTEDVPERRTRRARAREETEEQERSPAPTPTAEARPARRRPFGADKFEPAGTTSQPPSRRRF